MQRVFAIIERELRRLRRAPMLIVMSLLLPHGAARDPGPRIRRQGPTPQASASSTRTAACRRSGCASSRTPSPRTRRRSSSCPYDDPGQALTALRNGRLNGVLTIPPGFSRRALAGNAPQVALIEDNTDNFVSATLAGTMAGLLGAYNSRTP